MDQSYVAGIGGANVDIHGQSLAPLIMRDSNPGRLHVSVGGVTRNILDNLTRLGERCELVSAVGDDVYGRMLLDSCAALSIGTSQLTVRENHPSSSYISIMDSAGDMLVAMSDMRVLSAMDEAFVAHRLKFLNAAPVVVCDGNLPAPALEYLAQHCTAPLYVDPVSTTWAKKLLPVLGRFDTIKPNRLEMEVLAGMSIATDADLEEACTRVLAAGVRRVFVSLGADGIYYKGPEGSVHRRSRAFDKLVNATGAGDATMAGIIHATLAGKSESEVLNFALGAGLVAIAAPDTINEAMSEQAVHTMIKEYVV